MSDINNTSTNHSDVYHKVTDAIIHAIEQGNVGNWKMPWHTSGRYAFSPLNVTSRKPYRGINTLCLWAASQAKGYDNGEWGTYNQWHERGGAQVRRGEKSTQICFWKFANNTESEDSEDEPKSGSRLLFVRGYAVFNAQQVDGYEPKAEPDVPMPERIERAEQFFASIGADLRHGGNRAYYSVDGDYIQMPPFGAFTENVSYYSTLAHEHTHYTSKDSRCDRQLGKRFGDMAYAAEELIAELGASFVLATLGLSTTPREDHAQYINSWLKVLKADSKAIFTAASKAQQATDWLVGRVGETSHVERAA